MAQQREHQWTTRNLQTLLKLINGFAVHALLLVSQTAVPMRRKRAGIQRENLSALINCLIAAAGKVIDPAEVRTGGGGERLKLFRAFGLSDRFVESFQRN